VCKIHVVIGVVACSRNCHRNVSRHFIEFSGMILYETSNHSTYAFSSNLGIMVEFSQKAKKNMDVSRTIPCDW
jgi:hypothetical protein